MFESIIEDTETDRVKRYRISSNRVILTYSSILNYWQSNRRFCDFFTTLLSDSPFSGYRWETPAVTKTTVDRPFEFVLINTPEFVARKTDANTYTEYFADDDTDSGIVTFQNLRGDATLVVPSPRTVNTAYGHLAAFIRNAPKSQVHSLWRVVGTQIQSQISSSPLWVSTAGGGVAWLHVRLDSRPKYYSYAQYKTAS